MPGPPTNSPAPIHGRGAHMNPPNRFEPLILTPDPDYLAALDAAACGACFP